MRETKFEDFLTNTFKSEIRARNSDPDNRRGKFSNNSLFDGDLDKTVKDLSKTDHKVVIISNLDVSLILLFFSSQRW